MVMRVLILTGGAVEETFAADYIKKWNPDKVITADKGLLYAKKLDIKPDIILGDFDSCNKDVMEEFSTDEKIIAPCEKDDTDTGLAMQKAIETGADEILLVGGTGTRLDHVLGNIGQLFYAHSKGVKAELIDANNRMRVLDHKSTVSKKDQFGKYVSLIPIYEAKGVTLQGFKYPLNNDTLVFHESWGISNELEAEEDVTTNKVTRKLEKVLWAVLILMFIISVIGMFLGQYMNGNVFYKMCVIMTILAAAILSAERFYFGKEMGRDMPEAFKIGYWLIIAWAVILLIHAAGLAFLPFLMELEYRVLWVVVPTVSLLWMTRYIFGDNLDWDKTDKKGWKEGRMNYSQKSNKKNIGR